MNGKLSRVLKERRAALGLTMKQVADAVGVSEATVQRWENAGMNIRYEKAALLAEVLRVDPGVFFGWGSEDKNNSPSETKELSDAQRELISIVEQLPEDVCRALVLGLRQQLHPDDPDGQ